MSSDPALPRTRQHGDDARYTVHHGDARDISSVLREASLPTTPFISATITSPPYGPMKDYGPHSQLGWSQDYDVYRKECRAVLAEVHALSLETATLWLVLDTIRSRQKGVPRLEPLPFHIAEEAEAVGWHLRDIVIWRKDRTLPWSGAGRLRNAFEYVMQFTKGSNFTYNIDALRDPADPSEWWVRFPERYHPSGRAPSNVWDIPIPKQGSWGSDVPPHACPLPAELVDRLILLSSNPDDVVLDPFAGTGIVVARARRLLRRGIGIELNKDFVTRYRTTTHPAFAMPPSERPSTGVFSESTIYALRVLKFAKVLTTIYARSVTAPAKPIFTVVNHSAGLAGRLTPTINVVFSPPEAMKPDVADRLTAIATRRPLSKYGLAPTIVPIDAAGILANRTSRRFAVYENGNFWRYKRLATLSSFLAEPSPPNKRGLPLLSNVRLTLYADEER